MTLLGLHPEKLIDSLVTLAQAKEPREGQFFLTLKEEDRPGATITLGIQRGERAVPAATEREAPQAAPVRAFQCTTFFLRECHRTLFSNNEGKERELLISGASLPQEDSHWLDILVAVKLKHASFGGVEADIADLFTHLAELDVNNGLLLTGIFHSHLWRGRGAVEPSDTDRRLQKNLEANGYTTVQAVFSEDGYIGFFTNSVPFRLAVLGQGYEEVETHEHQTVLRLLPVASLAGRQGTQTPHVSHQTLHAPQPQGGRVCRSADAYRRV